MSTILDYLNWRGDVLFTQTPANEVDAYVLAKIGVPDLEGLVPEDPKKAVLQEVYRNYFARTDIDPDYFGRLNLPVLTKLLRRLPETPRFRDLLLSSYLQKRSVSRTEQISALTLTLPRRETWITFRGTDDTIIGWKENFLMAVEEEVPAQRDALDYLIRAAERCSGPLTVCGHSKGGNLAVYAAAMAPEAVQRRITAVYNFDGPGFRKEFWQSPGTLRVKDRTHHLVSQHTIVGTLLAQADEQEICKSKKKGPVAHEALNWDVMGPVFVREKRFSRVSSELDVLLNRQIEQLSREELRAFIEEFFGVLTCTGVTTLTELTEQPLDQLLLQLKKMNGSPAVREFGRSIRQLILDSSQERLTQLLKKKK